MYETSIEKILEAQKGNNEILQEIIENNSKLIWSIVKRFESRGYEKEDLYQLGAMGFIKAIKRFDEKFEVKISTYAVPYIIGEIKRFIRDDGIVKISRSIKELKYKIYTMQKDNYNKTGKELSVIELSKILKVSKEDIILALETTNNTKSLDDETFEDSNIKIIDTISDKVNLESKIVDKILVKELINCLNNREKKIILLRYYKNQTQMQVAKTLGITQVQVSRIEKKILSDMKRKII